MNSNAALRETIASYLGIVLLLVFYVTQALGAEPAPAPSALPAELLGLQLLSGPWNLGVIHRESALFVKDGDGKPNARLLFDAEKVIAVQSADGKTKYQVDSDYQLASDGSRLTLSATSKIPYRKHTDFFLPKGSPNSIGHRQGHPDISLLYAEGHFFHDLQVEVTYLPVPSARWTGTKPGFAEKTLPATIGMLRAKKPLMICVSGDSITQGYNASKYNKASPLMPRYTELIAAQLESSYGAKISLHNRAIAGWSVGQGVADLDNLLRHKPDLFIIAYGMNDVGARNPEAYKTAIATMLRRIKSANPATETILVASMVGNPEWVATPHEMFPKYRDALVALQETGVVVADMTVLWEKLLERKRYTDMTGNGVNHPNDYGHRLYAQAILALLVDPQLAPRSNGKK